MDRGWAIRLALLGVIGTFFFGWLQTQPQLCQYGLPFPICLTSRADRPPEFSRDGDRATIQDQRPEPSRAADTRIAPEPYSLAQLDGPVADAVRDARAAQRDATRAAEAVRQAIARGSESARLARAGDARFVVRAGNPEWRGEQPRHGETIYGTLVGGGHTAMGEFRYDERMVNQGAFTQMQWRFFPLRHSDQSQIGRFEGTATGSDSQWTGPGKYFFSNGDLFEGVWRPGSMTAGVWTYANGQRYEGRLEDVQQEGFDLRKHGYGVLWDRNGQVIRAGGWHHGEFAQ